MTIATTAFSKDMVPPTARWMGMDLVEHDSDKMYSKVTFDPNPNMINFGGVIQGGFLTAMMDDAMGFNAFISLGMKQAMASIDLHTHYYSTVPMGTIIVEAWVIRAGKSVAFLEAKLYDKDNNLAARAASSSKLRPFTGMQFDTGKS